MFGSLLFQKVCSYSAHLESGYHEELYPGWDSARRIGENNEVFLVHPGGPFWSKKDLGAWSIPKGLIEEDEEMESAARREFKEETGIEIQQCDLTSLGSVKQSSNKTVYAWALEYDFEPSEIKSNTFTMEWPPGSGNIREYPEVDRGAWFPLDVAREKILKGQLPLLERLLNRLYNTP